MRNAAFALLAAIAALSCTVPARSAAPSSKIFRDCPDCVDMVVIPAGSIEIGSLPSERIVVNAPASFGDRESPRHLVTIRTFALSKTEITRGLYARFVRSTGYDGHHGCASFDRALDAWPIMANRSWRNPGFVQQDNEPVVCINWNDAVTFAAWYAKQTGKPYRLPSEAEWEYAARAGTRTAFPWGDTSATLCKNANVLSRGTVEALGSPKSWDGKLICSDARSFTLPVASFPANDFGVNDMIGNAWEWVADCAHDTFDGAPVDGSAWDAAGCTNRVVRGGGYQSEAWVARSASRGGPPASYTEDALGIRLARDFN